MQEVQCGTAQHCPGMHRRCHDDQEPQAAHLQEHHAPASAACEQSQPQHQPSPPTQRGMGTQGQAGGTLWGTDRERG